MKLLMKPKIPVLALAGKVKLTSICTMVLLYGVSMSLVSAASKETPANLPPKGFTALFNGKDLSNWWGADTEDPRKYLALPADKFKSKRDASLPNIREHWHVQNGILENDGHGLFLTSDQTFGNFELLVDYKTVALADSGIYLRGCPQVQIWDSTEKAKFKNGADKGSGGLWNNSPGAPGKDPLAKADKPFGEWNHLRIVMVGSRVWVWLNDIQTVKGEVMENYFDRKLPVPPRGPIQLQTHGGKISWRNVFIRDIGSDESIRLLRASDPAGFKSVFNGKDLTGWAGPLECCKVSDSTLVWQKGKGGTIFTKDEYSDFIVRFEFKLPPRRE